MPLLSLAHELKKTSKDCRLVYIGLKGESLAGELSERLKVFDKVYYVPAGKFRRYHGETMLAHLADIKTILLNIRDFFRVLSGIGYSMRLMSRIKPDAVFSKGGFVAVPVGLAAAIKRIPIITHDSDAIPGLANRIIGRFASIHATGMAEGEYSYPRKSIRYVGIPLDERILPVDDKLQGQYKRQVGLPKNSLVLLVGGAGLGAKSINDKMVQIAPKLLESFNNLHIVHVTGQQHSEATKEAYKNVIGDIKRIKTLGFTAEFYKYTGAADVVVTRAGATTIAELSAQRKAVILIPAPHLAGGHQLKNAAGLEKDGAVETVDDTAPADELEKAITGLLSDNKRRRRLADKLAGAAKHGAAKELAALLLQAAGTHQGSPERHV
jgi:UDP-N-acetylglucosamine--N-acetylmuramyl-(pentapeptide) pyrophosphoryl-undecaprenol N-acetylglucosamine transferase